MYKDDLKSATEYMWGSDAQVFDTSVEGIYDTTTSRHGGYLVDITIHPQLKKYGERIPTIPSLRAFEEDYEALKVLWVFPELIKDPENAKEWLTAENVLRFDEDKKFLKDFPECNLINENKNIEILDIEELDKDDLLFLIGCYNNYIVEFPDEHKEGMYPVSIYEFYENEFQEILDEQNEEEKEKKILDIFREEYKTFPDEKGMIPANSTLLEGYSLKDIKPLVDKGILQKRDCVGLAFEFTNNYLEKIKNELENENGQDNDENEL